MEKAFKILKDSEYYKQLQKHDECFKKAKEAFVILGDKYFNLLKETNPRGDFKHFIKMAVEYGFRHGYNAANEWISVDDELPEIKNDGYWFIGKDKDDIHYALYIDSIVEHEEITATEITHWRPINND